MGNCLPKCRRKRKTVQDDHYHRSSPKPSGHLSYAHPTSHMDGTTTATMSLSSGHCSPVSAASAEVCTLDTHHDLSVMSGTCSPSHLTSAEVSVCPDASGPSTPRLTSAEDKTDNTAQEPAGPCSPSELTSAEVNVCPESSGPSEPSLTSAEDKTDDTAQEPAGPCSPPQLTSAEVNVCPESSGPSTPSLTSAEDKTDDTAQEPAGPCSPPHLTSAEVSVCPWSPACLASAEVETVESWESDFSGPSESWENDISGPSENWESDTSGPSENWDNDTSGPSENWESDTSGPSENWENDISGPSENWESDTSEPSEYQSLVCLSSAQTTGYHITLPSCDIVNLSSFTLHSVLGEGSFGKVVLATHQQSQQKVAIKSVVKSAEDHEIKTERYVLERAAGSPFLTQLYATFQTNVAACFVMEYLCGGTLLDFSERHAPLHSDTIKFIVAEISCGLLYLHSRGILHGDMKLENILMDGNGHIRIADFGLATANLFDVEIATGAYGSIGYMAPEVINNDFYQLEPDWFSLGVMTYMMAIKRWPFKLGSFDEYRSEVNFIYPVYPPDMDPDLEDLIKGLLCKHPDERLGVKDVIRSHPFFDSIDWEELEQGRTPPPFPVDTPMDMEMTSRLSPSAIHPKSSDIQDVEVHLPGFTYINSAWERM